MDINSFIIGFKKGKQSGGGGDGSDVKYIEKRYAEVNLQEATRIKPYFFYMDSTIETISMPKVVEIGQNAFQGCMKLRTVNLPEGLISVGVSAFSGCNLAESLVLPSTLQTIGGSAFSSGTIRVVTFRGKPQSIGLSYMPALHSNVTTVNCPWSEGEVAGAPWGATSAQINYNYTGG